MSGESGESGENLMSNATPMIWKRVRREGNKIGEPISGVIAVTMVATGPSSAQTLMHEELIDFGGRRYWSPLEQSRRDAILWEIAIGGWERDTREDEIAGMWLAIAAVVYDNRSSCVGNMALDEVLEFVLRRAPSQVETMRVIEILGELRSLNGRDPAAP